MLIIIVWIIQLLEGNLINDVVKIVIQKLSSTIRFFLSHTHLFSVLLSLEAVILVLLYHSLKGG